MTRHHTATLTALVALSAALGVGQTASAQAPIGTWELVSRTDSSAAGVQPADGPLGSDPIAWISYDTRGHVQAQLMARDRAKAATAAAPSVADPNNSAASGGYDAYFGTYTFDAKTGTVTHHLIGALSAGDMGRTLTRHVVRRGDEMVIWFEARRGDGAVVTRRLRWRKIG
ncbi:MAG: lipocalin-like domain-containing protein [Gemmatimonadaceae bacterium]|nr:lipocalin-like domain-containing protein [Gemmatimonadaceae bacterium]